MTHSAFLTKKRQLWTQVVRCSVRLDSMGTHGALHKRDCSLCQKRTLGEKPKSAAICSPAFTAIQTANFSKEAEADLIEVWLPVDFENKRRWSSRTRARYAPVGLEQLSNRADTDCNLAGGTTTVFPDGPGLLVPRVSFPQKTPGHPQPPVPRGIVSTGSPRPFLLFAREAVICIARMRHTATK